MVTHLPSQKGDRAPQLSAHVHCAQTAGWIKMSLGRKVGLDPSNIALDGDSAPLPKKGAEFPQFWPMSLLCQNGWTDQHATWYGGRPRRKPHCARWGPSILSPKRGRSPLQFSAHVYCDQTVAHLSYCWALVSLPDQKPKHIIIWGGLTFIRQKNCKRGTLSARLSLYVASALR